MARRQKTRRGAGGSAKTRSAKPAEEIRVAEPANQDRAWRVLAAVLAIAVLLVFANSLGNGFVFDDGDIVVGEPAIRELGNWRGLLADTYRPLRTITYAVDYAVWGLQPFGFRLTNIALHALNGVLAFVLARKVTGGDKLASFVAVLVMLLHPAQSESVAYISGRRDVLFATFYLSGFLCYTRFVSARVAKERVAWLAGTAVSFVLGLMSKEMAVSLPLACALWDYFTATEPGEDGTRVGFMPAVLGVLRKRAVLVVAAILGVSAFAYYTLVIRRATSRAVGTDIVFWGGSFINNLLTVPLTYAHYAKVALFPVTLSAQYYGAFQPAGGLLDPRVIPAILLLVALVFTSIFLITRTRHRVLGFGLAWFLIVLLPASQIFPHHEIVADHYLYLPLLGVGLALAGAAKTLTPSAVWRRRAFAVLAVLIVLFAARTYTRNKDWKSEQTLWEATFAAVPESPRAAYNLGFVATQSGDTERAIRLYRLAIQGEPTFLPAYRNLASSYGRMGLPNEAREVYEQALTIDLPQAARTWHMKPASLERAFKVELALIDARAGQMDAALEQLLSIVETEPNAIRAQDAIVTILQNQGRFESVLRQVQDRAAKAPEDMALRLRLAYMLWKANRFDESFALAERTLADDDESSLSHYIIGVYYGQVHPERAPSPYESMERLDDAGQWAPSYLDEEMIDRKRAEIMGPPRA